MASKLIWEASFASCGNVLSMELNSLANDTITAAGSAVDNTTNLDVYGWLELNVTFGSSPTDSVPTVDVYMSISADGTNYASDPVTSGVDCGLQQIISIPTRKVTSAQRKVVGPFLLPPGKFKFLLDNQTGVSFPASGSTVTLYTSNIEGQ